MKRSELIGYSVMMILFWIGLIGSFWLLHKLGYKLN